MKKGNTSGYVKYLDSDSAKKMVQSTLKSPLIIQDATIEISYPSGI